MACSCPKERTTIASFESIPKLSFDFVLACGKLNHFYHNTPTKRRHIRDACLRRQTIICVGPIRENMRIKPRVIDGVFSFVGKWEEDDEKIKKRKRGLDCGRRCHLQLPSTNCGSNVIAIPTTINAFSIFLFIFTCNIKDFKRFFLLKLN